MEPTWSWSPLGKSERREIERVRGIEHASNLQEDVPKRMRHAALRRLHGIPDVKVEERVYQGEEAVGQGGAPLLWAESEAVLIGAHSLPKRGKGSEPIPGGAATSPGAEIATPATLDVPLTDQSL